MELARSCCQPSHTHLFAQYFYQLLVSEKEYDIETKPHVPNGILCKAAGLNQRPVLGKGICSDLNRTAQRLHMVARKTLETMSGAILNRSHSKFAAKSITNEIWCLKAIWWPMLTGWASIFDLRIFGQSAFANIHLLCYWPTVHNSISKICPKFQVISSHFFQVDELLDEHWAKIVQNDDISTPIYVECERMYRSNVCVQEFSYFVSGFWYSTWKIRAQWSCMQKIGCRWWNTTSHIPFFSSNWNEPMAKWSRWVAKSWVTWVRFLMSAEMPCCASAILRSTEPVSALTHTLFKLLRSLYFVFRGLRQWRSRADRVVNLNTTIWLPLFWRTWTRARANTRPHVLTWHMGRDYSYCRASELTDSQVSGFVYSWFLEIQKRRRPHKRLF